jgi:hypothetical protein
MRKQRGLWLGTVCLEVSAGGKETARGKVGTDTCLCELQDGAFDGTVVEQCASEEAFG